MLKKILSLSLIVVYLLSASGILLSFHHCDMCGNNHMYVFVQEQEMHHKHHCTPESCSSCQDDPAGPVCCTHISCTTENLYVKIQDEYLSSDSKDKVKLPVLSHAVWQLGVDMLLTPAVLKGKEPIMATLVDTDTFRTNCQFLL